MRFATVALLAVAALAFAPRAEACDGPLRKFGRLVVGVAKAPLIAAKFAVERRQAVRAADFPPLAVATETQAGEVFVSEPPFPASQAAAPAVVRTVYLSGTPTIRSTCNGPNCRQ
jgi:hypothetical protein